MADPLRFQHFEIPLREDGSLFELGRGAMGITYKAFDTNLRSFVALKVVNSNYLDNETARQRFLREARAAAALRHPNVANVFHLGEQDGNYFYAMEFIDGETVEAMMKREGAIPAEKALNIVHQVARALGAAQKQGLVHRDIKPANLMLVTDEDGDLTVKVIDFGLAKNTAGGVDMATLTLGGFLGTPHFASPEQLEERDLDVRSDIYSLGVTLFYMLAGRAPFSGSLAQVMSQHLHREPPLAELSGQPPQVVELLKHMLAKDAAARPQSPADLRREIESCLATMKSAPEVATAASPIPADTEDFETQVLSESAPTSVPIELKPEAVIAGRYKILHEAPAGDFGRVFKAILLETSEPVALLALNATFLSSATACTHIEDQVLAIQKIASPAIQKILSIERIESLVFVVLEWIEGPTFLDLMRARKALPRVEALALLRPLAEAFDALFAAGLPCPDLTSHQVVLAGGDVSKPVPAGACVKFNAISPDAPGALPEATLVTSPFAMMRDSGAFSGNESRAFVYELASLSYEILGGIRSGTSSGAPVPIAGLTEEANAALRRALNLSSASFPSCTVFLDAMEGLAVPEAPEVEEEIPEEASAWRDAPPINIVAPVILPTGAPTTAQNHNPVIWIAGGSAVVLLVVVLGFVFLRPAAMPPVQPPIATPTPAATPKPKASATPTPSPTPVPTPTPEDVASELHRILQAPSADPATTLSALLSLERRHPDKPEIHQAFVKWLNEFLAKAAAWSSAEREAQIHSLEVAAAGGSSEAEILLGELLINTNPAEALKRYLKEAEKGNTYAMVRAARIFAFGAGNIQPDKAAATKWFQSAADLKDPMGMYYLGKRFLDEKDFAQAVRYLKAAAAMNNPQAMDALGGQYMKGIPGVLPREPHEAFALFSNANDSNYLDARAHLGNLYLDGSVEAKDEQKAADLFKSGAEQNNFLCMYHFAAVLEKGIEGGAPPNLVEATKWYSRAAQGGFPAAKEWCKTHKIEIPPPGLQ